MNRITNFVTLALMDVLNLAAVALFKVLEKNQINKNLLIEGTGLSIQYMDDLKAYHSWDQFVKMHDNCVKKIGAEQIIKEINYLEIFNENFSLMRKVGIRLLNSKTSYWYFANFMAKHLFKDSVKFVYKKIDSTSITMEILIRSDLKDCPLFLETYSQFFEMLSTTLGLPKASVQSTFFSRRAEYSIHFQQTSYLKLLWNRMLKIFSEDSTPVELINELENKVKELSKIVDQKSQLLRFVSHDIANQISIIDYYLSKTLKNDELILEDRKSLCIANSSTNKLANILKNVQNLELTSLRGTENVPVDLDSIFLSLEKDFGPQLEYKRITIKCRNELNPGVCVLAEASSLQSSVLGNLITNAIKFSQEGSVIELRAKLQGGKVQISVSDQGVGIPLERRESLFKKKLSYSKSGHLGESKIGLGLGIAQVYISLFNGKISMDANIPNGCIFTVELEAVMPQIVSTNESHKLHKNDLSHRNHNYEKKDLNNSNFH